MNKTIAITIAAIIIVAGGIFLLGHRPSAPASTNTSAPSETINPGGVDQTGTSTSAAPSPSAYTLADVAKHAGSASCWSAINGSVYDLTNWISQHPGGPQRILSICGTDGSSAFNAQHGGDPRVASILASMKIGALAQ